MPARSRTGVEPLQVVDRDDDAALLGQMLQRTADGPERPRVDGASGRVLDEERDLERAAAWRRQGREHLVESAVEQVAEPGVGERALGLGRTGREHAEPAPARVLDGRAPERRLADPRRTFERERDRPDPAAGRSRNADSELSSSSLPTTSTVMFVPSSCQGGRRKSAAGRAGPTNVVSVREQQLQRDEEKAEPEIRGDDGERPEPAGRSTRAKTRPCAASTASPSPNAAQTAARGEDAQRPEQQGDHRREHGLDDRRLVAGDVSQLRER